MATKNRNDRNMVMQWHITHRCNLRCTHCYQEDYSAFGTRFDLLRVLEQFDELLGFYQMRGHINITGGEPLLHPDLFFLLNEVRKRGWTFGVLTNGTLIDRYLARRLSSYHPSFVQISLDGLKKTHDKIRGEGNSDRAIDGICHLKSYEIPVMVSFTAQRENRGELDKLSRVCKKIGVDKLWFDRVVIPAADDTNGLTLSADEYDRLLHSAARINRHGRVHCDRALQFLYAKNKRIYRCSAGDRLLIVQADGSVMPCRRIPLIADNIKDHTLLQIYRDNPLFCDIRQTPLPEACGDCRYAQSCHGGAKCIAYAKTNRYDIPDPDCPLLRDMRRIDT